VIPVETSLADLQTTMWV